MTEYSVPYAFVEETADRNPEYETFVRETYTQLPDDIRAELEPYVSGARTSLQTNTDALLTQKACAGIAQYVSNSAAYSLDTPRVPEGEDFALWFLRESDTGSCVHFATATVLLLRAADIPARYVTGYYFKTAVGQWADVTEDDAHAWVEYYLDGYGWQVLDPTPAAQEDTAPSEPEEKRPSRRRSRKNRDAGSGAQRARAGGPGAEYQQERGSAGGHGAGTFSRGDGSGRNLGSFVCAAGPVCVAAAASEPAKGRDGDGF